MRKSFFLTALASAAILSAQTTKKLSPVKSKAAVARSAPARTNPLLVKVNDSVPALIPQKKNGLYGYINQRGKVMIRHQFTNAGFFYEDCNLLNSPNEKVKKYGSDKYASVRDATGDYRIDASGRKIYKFKDADLAQCGSEFKKQLYHAYIKNGFYGIIEDAKFENEADYRQYQIFPQYDYLHIMEGDDLNNPMIIASYQNRFGVIDKNNKVVIPFEYADIKRNFSWKIGRLFEVTKDHKNYYFVDEKNHAY